MSTPASGEGTWEPATFEEWVGATADKWTRVTFPPAEEDESDIETRVEREVWVPRPKKVAADV